MSPFKTLTVAALLALPQASPAATFFADTFGSGSTLNQPPATPTPNATSYQTIVGLTNGSWSLGPGRLSLTLPNSSSVLGEVLALFTNSPATLTSEGHYIAVAVVFTNTANILSGLAANNATLNIGLFNSGGVTPNQGNLISSAGTTSGGTEDWIGYAARIYWNPSGSANIFARLAQTPNGATSQNQDLLFSGVSSSQSFNNPPGLSLGTTAGGVTLNQGGTYTLELAIHFVAWGIYGITNTLYEGADTAGTVLFTQGQTNSELTYLTGGFDALAIGWRNSASAAQTSTMDISSITVSGAAYVPPNPILGPVSVVVATNGSCAFAVTVGAIPPLLYQWQRFGTNLLNGGNISGATSSRLIVSPAGTNDVCSGTNGYCVIVTGAGNFSAKSINASLTLGPAADLVWSGVESNWDVAISASWLTGSTGAVFHCGDRVTFDDTAAEGHTVVNLAGDYVRDYLSAAEVTVSSSVDYTFTGPGGIAGPGALTYEGSGPLTLNCANIHSGGTIISNAAARLVVGNYDALGTGPVTFAKAGGMMEIVPAGSAASGIQGDVVVADDFTIQFDGVGSYAAVFQGNLRGAAGKTLTLSPQNLSTTNRYRVYGTSTVYDANLVLNGSSTSQALYYGTVLAPYHNSGSQTYNGIISGNGGLVQRGSGITILNGPNTYSGGTTPTTGVLAFGTDSAGSVTSGPIGIGPLFLAPEVPNLTGSGQVRAWNGARTLANPIQYPSATNNLMLVIGGTNALTFSGPISLNGADGTGTFTNRTFQVTNTALTTFSGVVSDGGLGFGLTKTGSGILALNNTETYTGPTIVSNGTLQVNGSLDAASAVTVCANATLAGTGAANGSVTVLTNGTLAPGAASFGTLVLGNLSLAGNVAVKLDQTGYANDKLSVRGALTNTGAGTVRVIRTGAAPPVGHPSILFNKAVPGGDRLRIVGAGVAWDNQLAINGTIVVASTNPPTLTATCSGSNLTLSWPGYPGWLLQSNSVSLDAATQWFTVPGSDTVTLLDITLTTQANVFFRLLCP